ncbi:ABC transporter permease [Actinokineospora bangkokensis]|uniref:ABC transporter n=1 Tax=Actinokineospora bangkokensis TaxID=1193682 RepID=A0A1Q9LQR2_9PSEU|nr:ABC transporter permease [Actinokineospora bangkokensis]OLR94331.1 ABC transporter [Actinokineospora bangkokensis]
MNARYLALELRRTARAPRFLIFTVGFPVVFYLLFSSVYGGSADGKAVLMVGMAAFGGMTAAVSTGTRIAAERAAGWQRQLLLTPLSGTGYLLAKAMTAMVVALGPILLVGAVGAATGVHLPATGWLQALGGTWVALLPFAVLGVLIGQVATADSVQAIGSATFLLLSLGGGLWFPPEQMPAWLRGAVHVLPSYWYGGIGRDVVLHDLRPGQAVAVLAAWTAGLGLVVARRFRADGARA